VSTRAALQCQPGVRHVSFQYCKQLRVWLERQHAAAGSSGHGRQDGHVSDVGTRVDDGVAGRNQTEQRL
jgi:hypothetical protein